MAFERIQWTDEVVERPETYEEAVNPDGSITHTQAHGEVLQEGTPQSASNFNRIEEGLQHLSIAHDLLEVTQQMKARELEEKQLQFSSTFVLTEDGVDLGGRYLDNALFR
ncbi:MAG: hypothetical protein GXY67_07870 [Clostridiales bacterium]|nr:hypothetical protein [Clostridiales bacterium]